MSWLKPNLLSSIYGLLGNPLPPSDSMLESGTEDIRESMLKLLGDAGPKHFPQITRRIRYASDVFFEAALLIALFGFVGSASMAKFLLRGEVIE